VENISSSFGSRIEIYKRLGMFLMPFLFMGLFQRAGVDSV
jgi:hypothetical protein